MRRTIVKPLFLPLLLLILLTPPAAGAMVNDPLLPATKEPNRYAFIIGNGLYQRSFSNLDDLTDACDEAINFRKELLSLGWHEDQIYPLVKRVEGQTEEDSAIAAVCDLKNADLENGLKAFIRRLLLSEDNPYGVVYYAGHGAQSNDEFYAFGVDSNVDFAKEIALVEANPNYEIFSPDQPQASAVNLTRIVSQMNGPKGKALLMIVNACRNDPVLDDFLVNRTVPNSLDPEKRRRMSLGYINTRPDKYDRMYQNIIVMFSGRPEQPANGGTAAKPNWFSQELMRYVQNDAHQSTPTPIFVSDFETKSKYDQLSLPEYSRQIPSHIGSMASTPVYCLKGCAQPLPVWVNEKVEVIMAETRPPTRELGDSPVANNRAQRPLKISLLVLAGLEQSAPLDRRVEAPSLHGSEAPRHAINLDVFYCSGDPSVTDQEDLARNFAEETRQAYPITTTISDSYIAQIRLRSLDVNANLALNHPKVGTTLVLDRANPASREWQSRLGRGFERVYMDDVTKGFFRAYFCEGFSSKQKPRPFVYTQVARKNQVAFAQQLLAPLSEGLPNIRFVNQVEPVDETHPGSSHAPDTTQIRYYTSDQRTNAESIATILRQSANKPVSVVKMPKAVVHQKSNPVIELWFGRDEMASWLAAPPAH